MNFSRKGFILVSVPLVVGLAIITIGRGLTDLLETSEKETKRLIALINNLLDVERLELGKIEMHKDVVDIEAIVSQAINSVGYLAEKSGVKIAT